MFKSIILIIVIRNFFFIINYLIITLHINRECPSELREAVASVIFAAPRCSDLPDLMHIRNLFAAKYGKEFIAAATELRPDTSVNRTVKIFSNSSFNFGVILYLLAHIIIQMAFPIWIFPLFTLQIIEKLSISAPSAEIRLKLLKEIAQEHNVEWDSSTTEAEFSKKPEDLLVLASFCFMFLSFCGYFTVWLMHAASIVW